MLARANEPGNVKYSVAAVVLVSFQWLDDGGGHSVPCVVPGGSFSGATIVNGHLTVVECGAVSASLWQPIQRRQAGWTFLQRAQWSGVDMSCSEADSQLNCGRYRLS